MNWRLIVPGCIWLCDPTLLAGQAPSRASLVRPVREIAIDPERHDLSPIAFIALARDGRIVVGQPQDLALRVFNPDGSDGETVGRGGEGPGEFRNLFRAGWYGDSLWVYDQRLSRVTVFTPRFAVARTIAVPRTSYKLGASTLMHATVTGVLGNDQLEVLGLFMSPLQAVFARVDPANSTGTAVFAGASRQCALDVSGGRQLQLPYCSAGAIRTSPAGGFVVVVEQSFDQQERGVFTVSRVGTGSFQRTFQSDTPPLSVTAVDSVVERRLAKLSLGAVEEAAVRAKLRRPSRYPGGTLAVPGRDGSIYVGHSGPRLRRWTVIRQDGTAVAEFDLPMTTEIMAVTLGSFWAVEVDDNDVQTPVRYRLAASR